MKYKWACIGTGQIAREMAEDLKRQNQAFYAVANRTYDKAVSFAKEFGIEKVYEEIEQLFEDEGLDVVYLASPHNTHYGLIKKALLAGKHVLAEKAITLNSQQLNELSSLAASKGLVLAEAMTIYHMPLFQDLKMRIDAGHFGPLELIQVNFGSFKEYKMDNRFFNPALAGGALLDIGVYALSFCNWFMEKPASQIQSQVKKAASGVDESSVILLKNEQEQMASVTLSLHAKQAKRASLICQDAYIEIYDFPRAEQAQIHYTVSGQVEVIQLGQTQDALLYEINAMEAAIIKQGDVYLQKSQEVMDIMTQLRADWHLSYPDEGVENEL